MQQGLNLDYRVKLILSEWIEQEIRYMTKDKITVFISKDVDKDASTIFLYNVTKNKKLFLGIEEFISWFNIDIYNQSINMYLKYVNTMLDYMLRENE